MRAPTTTKYEEPAKTAGGTGLDWLLAAVLTASIGLPVALGLLLRYIG